MAEEAEWIEWKGGECPVGRDTAIEYRHRDGLQSGGRRAGSCVWEHGIITPKWDIISYRIVEQSNG